MAPTFRRNDVGDRGVGAALHPLAGGGPALVGQMHSLGRRGGAMGKAKEEKKREEKKRKGREVRVDRNG